MSNFEIAHRPRFSVREAMVLSRTLTLQPDALEEAAPCVDNDAGHYVTKEHHENTRSDPQLVVAKQ